jgi:chorismate dehydratase
MQSRLKVGAVSYINTKPLIYGFEQGYMNADIELLLDYPSKIAHQLQKKEIDIGLIPVAGLLNLNDVTVFGNTCIASEQKVASVCLFSNVPITEIQTIYLDYQSITSINLLKILLKEYWKVKPLLIPAEVNYIEQIEGTSAGVIIGDRAFEYLNKYEYVYDLSEAWTEFTNLPFVFACWVSNQKTSSAFEQKFNEVTAIGFNHLDKIIETLAYKSYDLHTYYTLNISYNFDDAKQKGMQLFLKKLKEL